MGFDDRSYHFYLIFGENIPGKEPWLENEWFNNFEPLFDKIIEISSYKKDTGLRVLEMAKETETSKYREYKMGKLKWDKKSNEKWTLKADDTRYFLHFEAWTPRWTICDKTRKAPDIYLSFNNEKNYPGSKKPLQFDILGSIAISEDIGNADREIIEKLSGKFNSKRTVYVKKTWFGGKVDENNKWNLKDWINYIRSWNGIYKDEKAVNLNIHSIDFKEIKFDPYWEIIY
jgi:hypothetical protein